MFANLELELPMSHKNSECMMWYLDCWKSFNAYHIIKINFYSKNYGDLKNCNENGKHWLMFIEIMIDGKLMFNWKASHDFF
jgi:hypothetical protein